VYVVTKKGVLLLYNTHNGKHIETDQELFVDLIHQLYEKENLGVIELTDTFRNDPECLKMIEIATEKQMVDTKEIENQPSKPIVFLPVLNLQSDIDKLKKNDSAFIGNNTLKYLTEVNLYLNGNCSQSCLHCNTYCLQTKYCTVEEKKSVDSQMNPAIIERLLGQMKYSSVRNINIIGGDLAQYKEWDQLLGILSHFDFEYHFWSHYRNVNALYPIIQVLSGCKTHILINFPTSEEEVRQCLERYGENENVNFTFLVENEEQLEWIEHITSLFSCCHVRIVPFFNATNHSFFEENIFMDKDDILENPVVQRTIFCNQKLNSNYFGLLNILSDGSVKANLNKATIGNIHNESLSGIIYRELLTLSSWRNVRSEAPCSECLYQYICPPPSDYEYALKKTNLCTV
jgi:pseudo-rSAM protein